MCKENANLLAIEIAKQVKLSDSDPRNQELKMIVLSFILDKATHILDFIFELIELLGLDSKEWMKKLYILIKIFCLQHA